MLTEVFPYGGFLLPGEANLYRARENVIVAEGENLKAGAVVGRITSGGKIAEYDNAASDGTQAAIGVLIGAVDATEGDKHGVIIARDCEVKKDALIWKTGADDTFKNAGIADMAALGIIVRS